MFDAFGLERWVRGFKEGSESLMCFPQCWNCAHLHGSEINKSFRWGTLPICMSSTSSWSCSRRQPSLNYPTSYFDWKFSNATDRQLNEQTFFFSLWSSPEPRTARESSSEDSLSIFFAQKTDLPASAHALCALVNGCATFRGFTWWIFNLNISSNNECKPRVWSGW